MRAALLCAAPAAAAAAAPPALRRAGSEVAVGGEGPVPNSLPRAMVVGVINLTPWPYSFNAARSVVAKGSYTTPPQELLFPSGAKGQFNYAWELRPEEGCVHVGDSHCIESRAMFGTDAADGANFTIATTSGGKMFGNFVSHSEPIEVEVDEPYIVGNASSYYSVHTVTIEPYRSLSPTCIDAVKRQCAPLRGNASACQSCAAQHRATLEGAGCDFKRLTDLQALACSPVPSVSCLIAAADSCPRKNMTSDLECNACIQMHRDDIHSACPGVRERAIFYSACVSRPYE